MPKTVDQFLKYKSWMSEIVAKQESYLKQSGETSYMELLAEQEKAKILLQSTTSNRTETFREWIAKKKEEA